MSANTLDTTKYNEVASNTVDDAVLDAAKILAWRQNVKEVVDQHATEIDTKVANSGGNMTGNLNVNAEIAAQLSANPDKRVKLVYDGAADEGRVHSGHDGVSFKPIVLVGSSLKYRPSIFTVGAAVDIITAETIIQGAGSPEGVITASVGKLFLRSDGGASTTLYVKQSGTGNTGWIAK